MKGSKKRQNLCTREENRGKCETNLNRHEVALISVVFDSLVYKLLITETISATSAVFMVLYVFDL